jgi:sigma-B regulation protein RsbU (phosphoserine phosphatase)
MKRKILIADDSRMNRRLLSTLLKQKFPELEILEATNGSNAIEIILRENITVVILDIMMPEMDGIEVLKIIKSNVNLIHIPVIMWSANNDIESLEKSLEIGALDYFSKPLKKEEMTISLPLKIKNAIDHYEQKLQLIQYNNHIKLEFQLAEKLQKSLIVNHASFETEEMWGKYIPCESIGGDFFSCKHIKGRTWFIIVDVSGHGIASAMLSTMISVVYNSSIEVCSDPGEVLNKINKLLYKTFEGYENSLASAIVGVIEGNKLTISNSGHPTPLLFRKDKNEIETINAGGFLLGIFEDIEFEIETQTFNEGDVLFLYTDGLYEKLEENVFCTPAAVNNYCELNKLSISNNINNFINDMVEFFYIYNTNKKGFGDDVAVLGILKK